MQCTKQFFRIKFLINIDFRENRRVIKNGKPRDTGVNKYKTQNDDKQNKIINKNNTQKIQRWVTHFLCDLLSKHYKCNLQQYYLFIIIVVSIIGAGNMITPKQRQSTCHNMAMVLNTTFNNISNMIYRDCVWTQSTFKNHYLVWPYENTKRYVSLVLANLATV